MKEFRCMKIITMKNTEGYHGYFCEERITADDVKNSPEIPKDLKENFNIYNFRHSDDGSKDFATIEPFVWVNFSGSFVTSADLSGEFDNPDDKYAKINDYNFYESFGEHLKLLDEYTPPMDKLPPYPPGFVAEQLSKLHSIWESHHKGDNKK